LHGYGDPKTAGFWSKDLDLLASPESSPDDTSSLYRERFFFQKSRNGMSDTKKVYIAIKILVRVSKQNIGESGTASCNLVN